MTCPHENFVAEVQVDRVWSGKVEGEGELRFHATIKIACVECRVRFAFPESTPMGLLWNQVTIDPTGLELRAPIRPEGHLTSLFADMPGFAIRRRPG